MKKLLLTFFLVSILFLAFLTFVHPTAQSAGTGKLTSLEQQRQALCIATFSSFIQSVQSGLQKLYYYNAQAGAIADGLEMYFAKHSNQTMADISITSLNAAKEKAFSQINSTVLLLKNFNCDGIGITPKVQQIQASFSQSIQNFEDYKIATKNFGQTILGNSNLQTTTPTATPSQVLEYQ